MANFISVDTEYFECKQFDEICKIMNVKLREKNQYKFQKAYRGKAGFQNFFNYIKFEKSWLFSLSPKSRCAVLIHELGHKITRNLRLIHFLIIMIVSILTILIVQTIIIFISFALNNLILYYSLIITSFILYVIFGINILLKHLIWEFEYLSDEYSVKYIGIEPIIEFLNKLRSEKNNQMFDYIFNTHPPIDLRIKHIKMISNKYAVPLINFEELNNKIPQVFQD